MVRSEVQRKLFHSLMVLIAIVNWIGGPLLSIGFTGIVLVVFLTFDFLRIRAYGYFPFRHITDRVMRPTERTRLGANVYFAVGTLFIFLMLFIIGGLFRVFGILSNSWMVTGWLAVGAVVVAAIGDGGAALVGLRWGRLPLRGTRTIEGSIGGFIIGFLSFLPLWLLVGMHWIYGLIAATMLIVVDLVNLPINDNLINPVVIGFTLAGVEILLSLVLLRGVG